MKELIKEFITNNQDWEYQFLFFYKRNQIHPFHFGRHIHALIKDDVEKVKHFLAVSIETISHGKEDKKDIAVLGGFISELDSGIKEFFFAGLCNDDRLAKYLFYFFSIESPSFSRIQYLFHVSARYGYPVSEFEIFEHKNYLKNFDDDVLICFCAYLMSFGKDGYQIAFNLLYPYLDLDDNSKRQQIIVIPFIRACIKELGLNPGKLPNVHL